MRILWSAAAIRILTNFVTRKCSTGLPLRVSDYVATWNPVGCHPVKGLAEFPAEAEALCCVVRHKRNEQRPEILPGSLRILQKCSDRGHAELCEVTLCRNLMILVTRPPGLKLAESSVSPKSTHKIARCVPAQWEAFGAEFPTLRSASDWRPSKVPVPSLRRSPRL